MQLRGNRNLLYNCTVLVWIIYTGHAAHMGERRGSYRALVGKPEGRRPPERPRRRWEDNIKMDLR
jgi:hypothetical protein